MSSKNEHIILRIKDLFANNNSLTQKDLASYLQKAPSTISQWLKHGREIPAECVTPICEFFGCSINWLLTGADIEYTSKLDPQQQKLLELYIQADERGKRNIMHQAEAEVSESLTPNKQKNINISMVDVGNRIKQCRKELGLTQNYISQEYNIDSGALSKIENGTRVPSVVLFYELAQILKCDMEWLITGNSAHQLSKEDQLEIEELIEFKLFRDKKNKHTNLEEPEVSGLPTLNTQISSSFKIG